MEKVLLPLYVTQLLPRLQQFKKYQVNSMLLKAAVPAAIVLAVITTSEPSGTQGNTSMAETSKQLVEWYREIITQLIKN